MKFARIVFWIAGIYGVLVITPLYFLSDLIGRQNPPVITHPEFFYGFVGTALAWQVAFLVIATDPARFRFLMLPSILEKITYVVAIIVLYVQRRVLASNLFFAGADLLLAVLFLMAFLKTASTANA